MTKPPSSGAKLVPHLPLANAAAQEMRPAPLTMAELVDILKAQPRTGPRMVRQPIEWPDRRADRSKPPEK
jgi:hypothetical protein